MARNEERRRIDLNSLAAAAGKAMPRALLKTTLSQALGGLHVSLCLHRVAPRARATDWQPELNISPTVADELIELMLASREGSSARWLSVTFDDGYEDARAYIDSRAAQYPDVDFIFFVCPEKLERRAGFRWDFVETKLVEGVAAEEAKQAMSAAADVEAENRRVELKALADAPAYALASVDGVKALQRHANVAIGNHTNLHLNAVAQPEALVRADYRASTEAFTRLFGPQRHFAFPFGTPRLQFDARHVAMLRELGTFKLWTTEPRPYAPAEDAPNAVLPRFAVNGTKSAAELAGWVAGRAAKFRLQGTKHHFA